MIKRDIIGTMEVDMNTLVLSCRGCPTIFEWKDIDGDSYYFRLRHGGWYIYDEIEGEIVVGGYGDKGLDGICDWEDVKRLARKEGLVIKEK